MEKPDSDPDQYQAELNDAVDDGGGCTETWEKLSDIRSSPDPRPGVDRRTVLKIGSLGIATTLVPGVATADNKKDLGDGSDSTNGEREVVIQRLAGKRRREAVDDALGNSDVQQLLNDAASEHSYNKQPEDAVAFRIRGVGDVDIDYRTVDLPFDTGVSLQTDEDVERIPDAFLGWDDRDDSPPTYTTVTYIDTGEDTARADVVSTSAESGELNTQETSLTTEEYRDLLDEIEDETDDSGAVSTFSVNDGVQTAALLPCGPCVPDLNCWYRLARAYGGIFAACSLCGVFKEFKTCTTCLGAIISAPKLGFLCDPCLGPKPLC
ncbi:MULTISPECIES: hypothetical protein [Haloferacaceae]|uniref:Uncharacterized protein n=1 Tax=Halolamina pelagica TaxID=699431 RepID=A0A1I5T6Y3_9EURY|nr:MULTISPECIES: hypothetical protein [Haloferacales]MUV57065.1 hypothetical protein [Halogeometricum sp. CBA1124]NHX37384.1 hypothetical protein [Halolamina sp. R1-12]SFP78783.1 hypothetical protein SAMN05216277_10850 [Halolamina pelagica]